MIKYLLLLTLFSACKPNEKKIQTNMDKSTTGANVELVDTIRHNKFGDVIERINLSDAEWKEKLTPQEYYVLREKGTERAFTGDLLENHKDGLYTCAACGLVLFKSNTKFDSGTGWPSFYQPEDPASILESTDYDLGYARTEVMCYRCGGHLGHVFPDGPKPTGLRYCINSVSLDFVESKN